MLWAFDFYGEYLVGQMSGMSEALDLGSVKAALEIDDVPRERWEEDTKRLVMVHNEVMKVVRRRAKRRKNG